MAAQLDILKISLGMSLGTVRAGTRLILTSKTEIPNGVIGLTKPHFVEYATNQGRIRFGCVMTKARIIMNRVADLLFFFQIAPAVKASLEKYVKEIEAEFAGGGVYLLPSQREILASYKKIMKTQDPISEFYVYAEQDSNTIHWNIDEYNPARPMKNFIFAKMQFFNHELYEELVQEMRSRADSGNRIAGGYSPGSFRE